MPIASAIATGIGAVASGLINAASQARTNAENRRQAEYAFERQQAAIREQNAYNSPSQQVLRMKAAGLNPSLAYGADGALVGNQSDIPAYNPIPAEAPNIGQMGSGIAEAVRTGIDVRDIERREELAKAEIAAKDWQNFLAFTQGNLNQAATKETLDLLGYKIENYESLTELNWENVLKARQEISRIKDEQKVLRSQVRLNDAQIEELAARVGLEVNEAVAILAKLPHEIQMMDAQSAFNFMQTDKGRYEIQMIGEEMSMMNFTKYMEQQKFDFEKNSWGVEQLKWQKEYRANALHHLEDNVTRIISLGVGASALRSGQSLPPRGPVTGSYGGSRRGVGSSWQNRAGDPNPWKTAAQMPSH